MQLTIIDVVVAHAEGFQWESKYLYVAIKQASVELHILAGVNDHLSTVQHAYKWLNLHEQLCFIAHEST